MSLPPLANLFAAYDPDPTALAALEALLRSSGDFRRVARPTLGWIVATSPLPGEDGADRQVADRMIEFVEGQDVVCERLEELCQLADRTPEWLARLPGDFGFVRFRHDGSATAVRSCGGLVPFYLTRSRDRIALATRLGDFARYLDEEPRIDPLPNAVWAMGWPLFPEGRSFLADVSVLPRGSFAHLGSSGPITTHRYWDLQPARLGHPTPARAAEHAERLRSLLVTKLERDLDPGGGNLLTLSGGVDSSSLAALAGGVVGRRFSTWSLLPEPDDLFRRDFLFIELLTRRFNIERTWITRMGSDTVIELLRSAPPVVFHVAHPALCALPRVLAEADVRVLFGGEFADEACGSVFTIPDWAHATSLAALLRGLRRLPFGRRTPLHWAKHRLLGLARRPALPFPLDLPEFARPDLREEYRTWAVARRRAAAIQPPGHRHLALRAEMDGFVAMNWEVASALGVRRSFPFFNREMLELAFECHPSELVGPGTKRLLRAALVDDVPRENLFRADKGHWGHYLRGVQFESPAQLPHTLESVVRPEWFPQPPHRLDLLNARALGVLTGFATALAGRRRLR